MRIEEIDHSVVAVNDLVLAERFYGQILTQVLGGYLTGTSGHTTEEVVRSAQRRAMAPPRESQADAASGRVHGVSGGPHSSVKIGNALVAIFIQDEDVQEPPPEQLRGTPRLSFYATPEQVAKAKDVFGQHKIAFEEFDHPASSPLARSLYFKDPSSNFLELCCSRS